MAGFRIFQSPLSGNRNRPSAKNSGGFPGKSRRSQFRINPSLSGRGHPDAQELIYPGSVGDRSPAE